MHNRPFANGDWGAADDGNINPSQDNPAKATADSIAVGEQLIVTGTAALRLGENDKALASYQQAIDLIPDNPEVYYGMGRVYFAKKEWQKARSYAQQAVGLAPDVARYHLAVAACAQKCRDLESVLTHLEAAHRTAPLLLDKRTRWVLAYSRIFAGLEKLSLLIVWGFLAAIWVHAAPSDKLWQWILAGVLPFMVASSWYFKQRLRRRAIWSLLICVAWVVVVCWLA